MVHIGIFLAIYSIVLNPVIGTLGTFVIFIIWIFPGYAHNSEDLMEEVSSLKKQKKKDSHQIRVKPMDQAIDILSYQQIIRGNNLDLKLKLMSLLALNPSEQSVRLLRQALDDSDETIRVLAGTCLEKLDDHFMTNVMKIQKQTEGEEDQPSQLAGTFALTREKAIPPSEAAEQFHQVIKAGELKEIPSKSRFTKMELARGYRDYLCSGLVPEQSRAYFQDMMITSCFEALEENTTDKTVLKEVSSFAMEFRQLSLLRLSLDLYLKAGGEESDIIWEEARYLYEQHEFEGVKKVLQNPIEMEQQLDIKEMRALHWWRE